MRQFVIADIHGQEEKLLEVFQKANFNHNKDQLICLGDIVDRGPNSKQVIEIMMTIKNLILILGNHDLCFVEWMMFKHASETWKSCGGQQTINSFNNDDMIPYINFFSKAKPYHIDKNRFFTHGCIPYNFEQAEIFDFMMDRSLARQIVFKNVWNRYPYSEVFLGHTVIGNEPIHYDKFWLMDTGAGFGGKITMMDINSYQQYQSEGFLKTNPNQFSL